MAELTVERLRDVLHYDPETGIWTWRKALGSQIPGRKAGCIDRYWGYRIIKIDNRIYRAGRLAFLYVLGEWPPDEVDHINRSPADDRWQNLRHATSQLNKRNRGMLRNNTSGFTGVSWHKGKRKWRACTKVNYRDIHIGHFDSKEEAHQAYLDYLKYNVDGSQ